MSDDKIVLLVEDNEKIMEANRLALSGAGYQIDTAVDLAAARACIARREPDVIVLDILLPDGNGLDFLAEIRKSILAPVILLTSFDDKDDVLEGLQAGGDDYITKPYDLDVLRAKVAVMLRRGEMYENRLSEKLVCGPLTLDLISQRAFLNGVDMMLTQKEYSLLLILARDEGKSHSAESVYRTVWGQPMAGDSNALKIAVSRLRRKLEGSGYSVFARRGDGYVFEQDE